MKSTESLLQLEEIIQEVKNNTVKYVLLYDLAKASVKEEKLDYAFQVYKEALNTARKMHSNKLEYETLIHLGDVADELYSNNLAYYKQIAEDLDQTDLVDYFYNEALTIVRKTNSFRVQSRILRKLADNSVRRGNLDLAAEYSKKAVEAARIADSRRVNIREEQPTNKPFPSNITIGSNLFSTIQKSIEVSNQIKRTEHLRKYQQYEFVVVAILLLIIIVVVGYIIFSKAISNPVIYLVFGMSLLIWLYTLYILIHNFSSRPDEN